MQTGLEIHSLLKIKPCSQGWGHRPHRFFSIRGLPGCLYNKNKTLLRPIGLAAISEDQWSKLPISIRRWMLDAGCWTVPQAQNRVQLGFTSPPWCRVALGRIQPGEIPLHTPASSFILHISVASPSHWISANWSKISTGYLRRKNSTANLK